MLDKNKFLDKFIREEINEKGRALIVLMPFGSHLYGTNTENSDLDYKGVFIPNREEFFLEKYPKTISFSTSLTKEKNTNEDVDIEIFSIHKFFKLGIEGQTVFIDMINAPNDFCLVKTPYWSFLKNHANLFYTKKLTAFLNYCRKQAAKYGIKGSRIHTVQNFLNLMNQYPEYEKLEKIWNKIKENEHIFFRYDLDNDKVKHVEICGKVLQSSTTIGYNKKVLEQFLNQYGKRARLASKNKNIDWKAVSHAIRAGYELYELYTTGKIKFPLKQASFIKEVKYGKHDFKKVVQPVLEEIIKMVENEAKKSNFPDKVNEEEINNILYTILFENYVL